MKGQAGENTPTIRFTMPCFSPARRPGARGFRASAGGRLKTGAMLQTLKRYIAKAGVPAAGTIFGDARLQWQAGRRAPEAAAGRGRPQPHRPL